MYLGPFCGGGIYEVIYGYFMKQDMKDMCKF